MLDFLAKKDKYWRDQAYFYCRNRDTADEIVQEMYLRFYRNYKKKEVKTKYVVWTIQSIYYNMLKVKKRYSYYNDFDLEAFHSDSRINKEFEPNDTEQSILNDCDNLKWFQKELLEESYDRSYRQIESEYKINYGFVAREITKARKQILNERA